MIVQINDWVFDVNTDVTAKYSANEAKEHCTCAYCRNYYAAADDAYPELRPFLLQFGLYLEAPDELIPDYQPNAFSVYYAVSGSIIKHGQGPLTVGTLEVLPLSEDEVSANTFLDGPHFFLSAEYMQLPWVLDEPIDEVESPAREEPFLKRIWNRYPGSFLQS